jgi:hypothetical protein
MGSRLIAISAVIAASIMRRAFTKEILDLMYFNALKMHNREEAAVACSRIAGQCLVCVKYSTLPRSHIPKDIPSGRSIIPDNHG